MRHSPRTIWKKTAWCSSPRSLAAPCPLSTSKASSRASCASPARCWPRCSWARSASGMTPSWPPSIPPTRCPITASPPSTAPPRPEAAGPTSNWTDYLTSVSKEGADQVGKGAAVKWPAASSVGGKGNEGVAANVTRVKSALGYVEYAYVKKNNMNYLQLQNADGKYVNPDDKTFASAAASADWFSVPGMGISMVNAKGADSWPVSTASFILMYKDPADKAQSAEVLKFFEWAFKNGKGMAAELDYVPLPDRLTAEIGAKVWSQIKK